MQSDELINNIVENKICCVRVVFLKNIKIMLLQ